jgi:hypothetical protein
VNGWPLAVLLEEDAGGDIEVDDEDIEGDIVDVAVVVRDVDEVTVVVEIVVVVLVDNPWLIPKPTPAPISNPMTKNNQILFIEG